MDQTMSSKTILHTFLRRISKRIVTKSHSNERDIQNFCIMCKRYNGGIHGKYTRDRLPKKKLERESMEKSRELDRMHEKKKYVLKKKKNYNNNNNNNKGKRKRKKEEKKQCKKNNKENARCGRYKAHSLIEDF